MTNTRRLDMFLTLDASSRCTRSMTRATHNADLCGVGPHFRKILTLVTGGCSKLAIRINLFLYMTSALLCKKQRPLIIALSIGLTTFRARVWRPVGVSADLFPAGAGEATTRLCQAKSFRPRTIVHIISHFLGFDPVAAAIHGIILGD